MLQKMPLAISFTPLQILLCVFKLSFPPWIFGKKAGLFRWRGLGFGRFLWSIFWRLGFGSFLWLLFWRLRVFLWFFGLGFFLQFPLSATVQTKMAIQSRFLVDRHQFPAQEQLFGPHCSRFVSKSDPAVHPLKHVKGKHRVWRDSFY